MAVNKNFVVKNGLEVGTDLILANTTNSRVGIGTSLPTDTLHVNGGIAGTDFVISGIATIPTLNSTTGTITNLSATTISMGSTAIVNSARQLQNIASLDATTTATIESAIEAGPNNFSNLNISGVSTFVGLATFGSGIEVQSGVSTFANTVDVNAGLEAHTVKAQNLSPSGVVFTNASGELSDSGGLLFDGYTLTPSGVNVTGVTTSAGLIDANDGVSISGGSGLEVTGAATVSTTLGVTGDTTLGAALGVTGNATIAGINTFTSDGANILGIVTATSFHGDISNTTGVSTNFTASVGIQSGGTAVGVGITTLNFIGAGNSISVNSGNTSIIDIEIAGGGGGAGAATSVGGNAPADPELGQLWYNNDLARTFVYYDEVEIGIGASAYWVDASPFDAAGQFLSKLGDNMSGALGIQTGSLAAPGLYINGSTNTGIAALKPNEFSFTSSGTEKLNVNATGARIVGTTTVTGNINAIDGVFTGNVTVGGTLTKQDVTNVDSVGVVTARQGVVVPDGEGYKFGDGSYRIEGKDDGANARIGFVAGGSEKLRINSAGNIGIGTVNPTSLLTIGARPKTTVAAGTVLISPASGNASIQLRGGNPTLEFDGTGGGNGRIFTDSADLAISSGTLDGAGTELVRIKSDGKVAMGLTDAGGTGCDPDGNALLIRAASTFQTAKGHIMLTGDSATNGQGPQIVFSESGGGSNAAGAYIGHVRTSSNSIGDLVFGTRNVSGDANTVPAERLRIGSNGAWGLNGTNYGTAGQVIKSAGSGSAVAWGDSTIGISSGGLSIGSPATLNFIGAGNTFAMNGTTVDISISGGGGGSGDFNTGLSGEFHGTAVGVGSTVFTFPSTAGKKYILRSLLATNVAAGNTDVNVIGAFDFNGGEISYMGYNIPIPLGMAAELLRQPQVLNPSDSVLLRSTDINRNGVDSIIEYYGTYEELNGADYVGVGLGANTLSGTTATTLYTSTGAASVLQSIRVANISDAGAKPVSISVVDGGETIRFVENLIVPKYGSIEILDNQKRIASGAIIKVTLDEGGTMGVQLSAKKIAAV